MRTAARDCCIESKRFRSRSRHLDSGVLGRGSSDQLWHDLRLGLTGGCRGSGVHELGLKPELDSQAGLQREGDLEVRGSTHTRWLSAWDN